MNLISRNKYFFKILTSGILQNNAYAKLFVMRKWG